MGKRGYLPKKTVDKRRKYDKISPAKRDEGAQRRDSGPKRGGRVKAPGRTCLRKPLPSGPGRPGRPAPVTDERDAPRRGDNQGGTVDVFRP